MRATALSSFNILLNLRRECMRSMGFGMCSITFGQSTLRSGLALLLRNYWRTTANTLRSNLIIFESKLFASVLKFDTSLTAKTLA